MNFFHLAYPQSMFEATFEIAVMSSLLNLAQKSCKILYMLDVQLARLTRGHIESQ